MLLFCRGTLSYLRVRFQVIKLSPVVDVTPIRLLFFCFRTV